MCAGRGLHGVLGRKDIGLQRLQDMYTADDTVTTTGCDDPKS